jgi:hypothetical protein
MQISFSKNFINALRILSYFIGQAKDVHLHISKTSQMARRLTYMYFPFRGSTCLPKLIFGKDDLIAHCNINQQLQL